MNHLTRRLRSLLIALAVLAISATVALAGRAAVQAPTSNPTGLQADGTESPEASESDAPEASESDSPEPSESDSPKPTDTTPATAGTNDTATSVHPDNHGKLVSEAAQGATPTVGGFTNHGQYVRTIAQNNAGQAAPAAAKHGKSSH